MKSSYQRYLARHRIGSGRIMDRATALWHPRSYDGVRDCLVDLSGNGLHARLGSAVGPDTNDPLRLQYSGQKFVQFPGSTDNYISTADNARFDWATSCRVTACVKLTETGGNQTLFGTQSGASDAGILIYLRSTVARVYTRDGVTINDTGAGGISGLTLSTKTWVRITGYITGRITFETSSDGSNWTAVYDQTLSALSGPIQSAGSPAIGRVPYTAVNPMLGGLCAFTCECDGVVVADFDASRLTEPYATYTDPQGNTWTLNRSSTGRKLAVVDRDLLLLGTDDYLSVSNSPLLNFLGGQPGTIALLMRRYGTPGALVGYMCKGDGGSTNAGWRVRAWSGASMRVTTELRQDSGTSLRVDGVAAPSAGVAGLVGSVWGNGSIQQYLGAELNGTSSGAIPDTANASSVVIGAYSSLSTFADMEFMGAAVFREALSADDLRRLAAEMGVAS